MVKNSEKNNQLEKNQENQRKYTSKREQEEKTANALVHKLVQKIDKQPNNYKTYYELATALVEGNSYSQAEELLMKAIGLFKNSSKHVLSVLNYGLGNVYYAAEEYDKAIKTFQTITEKSVQADAYIMLAQSYMAKSDNKRALVFALSAQETRRQDFVVNQLIGDNLLALGNFTQAGEFYDLALKKDQKNGPTNFNRGLVAMVNGEDFDKYFTIAKKQDPNYFQKGQQKLSDIEKFVQLNHQKEKDNNQQHKD